MEPEWVDAFEGTSVADRQWLQAEQNGSHLSLVPVEDSWVPIDLSTLPDGPPVQPTLGGLGILYPGKRHLFSGPQESAKTLAAYVVCLQVIREGGRIVLIDFEMGRFDARTRLRELGATSDEIGRIAFVEPETKITVEASERLVAGEPALVLIDATAGAFALEDLDDNKRGDVERFAMRYVEPFRRKQIATLMIDHVTKNVESRSNYAIGSERKVGQTDVHIGFTVVHPIKRGSTGVYKVTTHKDRMGFLKRGKLADFELASDPDTHSISWAFKAATETDEEHPFRPTHLMEKVSHWLERQYEPVPMSHIEEGVEGNRDYVRLAIQTLVDDGYITETSGPRKARLMEVARVYREAVDNFVDDLSPTSPDLSRESASSDLSSSPTPLRGGEVRGEVETGEERSQERSLLEDDGIPF